jgi:hypothetical protein
LVKKFYDIAHQGMEILWYLTENGMEDSSDIY